MAEPLSLGERRRTMTESSIRPVGSRHLRVALLLIGSVAFPVTGCGSDGTTETRPAQALTCNDDLTEIVELLRSGLPTYDYDPAANLAALVQDSVVVVAGTIDSLVRDGPDSTGDDSWTTVATADARILAQAGEGTTDVSMFSTLSKWVVRGQSDPLSNPVTVDGLAYVAFLREAPEAPGGFTPNVQGLFVSCVGTTATATPVIEPLPGEVAGLSLDSLIEAISGAATTE